MTVPRISPARLEIVNPDGRGSRVKDVQNIARGRPAQQSTTLDDSTMCPDYNWAVCGLKSADLAVDGDTWADHAFNYWKGSCSHTNVTDNVTAWWRVDLGSVHRVTRVGIYRPTNWRVKERTSSSVFDHRLRGFQVLVDGQVCYNHSVGFKTPPYHLITCARPLYGSKVTIVLPPGSQGARGEYLISLCEVQVYECSDFWFGEECDKRCNCRDQAEVCDKVSGACSASGCRGHWSGPGCQDCTREVKGTECITACGQCRPGDMCTSGGGCPHGCQDGWAGSACTECADRRFGAACNQFCNCRDAVEVCDRTTGQCHDSGCADGWTGTDCMSHCPNGTFGFQCKGVCGRCTGADVCHRVTGVCPAGCQYGWTGLTCNECNDFHFGPDCSKKCECRDTQEVCDKADGHCSSGCKDGYSGRDCQTACSDGLFGSGCTQHCGYCVGGAVCFRYNGTCPGGCLARRKEPFCRECIDGYFGESCDRMCGHCKDSARCDGRTGDCPFGCLPGWRGKRCLTVCELGFYGDECSVSCGHCAYMPCSPDTGRCVRGCQVGYTGYHCTECE
ncbi:multiple epidermal growth factor-like domains protein 10 [Gigantopelta aegis]|uniref:multiple epidermal growth factor-like domains protein 10 n=1 Tax=Gigantopelta aegis TaxID=1735272 RepID=UPI001B889FAE|nr:multiple epidermal growth factor-like domains protein 10 [Gigantopelta aegis]